MDQELYSAYSDIMTSYAPGGRADSRGTLLYMQRPAAVRSPAGRVRRHCYICSSWQRADVMAAILKV